MNRLWVRLTLAFVAVTLVGTATVAVLADNTIGSDFRQYALGQSAAQDSLAPILAAYYAEHGSWDGVGSVVPGTAGGGRGQGRGQGRPDLLVADAQGHIVYDGAGVRQGQALTAGEQAGAAPILSDSLTVGYLLLAGGGNGPLGLGAQRFLDRLHSTLIVAALIASGLGVLLGLLVSRALTAPLADVAQAARAFATRQWDRRVKVRGAEEIAEVGRAFNTMADSLQQAESLRRSLMADIAHELGTPLTVIQGNLRALLDGVYPLEQREISTLYDETRLLARLVDDLRELALADAGQLPLKLQALDLEAVLRATAERFSVAAEAQKVELAVTAGGGAGGGGGAALPAVRADADRLAQILRNLLANALRHTPSGGRVSLQGEVLHSAGAATHVRISVADTGSGIAPEDLAHVFERFYRGDKSRTRSSGGAGLGLAIARAWVTAMGGEIGVESAPGQGSCFWFTLPCA